MNARVVAATNRDLKRGCPGLLPPGSLLPTQRHSRAFRLRSGRRISCPWHILLRLNRQQGTAKLFGQAFKKALLAYRWPGNIRELNNIIERAFVLARSDTLELEDLPDEMTAQWLQRTPQGPVPAGSSLHCILRRLRPQYWPSVFRRTVPSARLPPLSALICRLWFARSKVQPAKAPQPWKIKL